DDPRLLLGTLIVDPSGQAFEPRLSVRIRQRNPRMHLGDVRFRMERVSLLEGPAEASSQLLRDRRFARPRHSHDHEDRRMATMGTRAVEAMHAGKIGDKDWIGAADEKSAFNHPDETLDALFQARRIGDWTETAVENAVAAIGGEGVTRRQQAHPAARAQHPQ